MGYRMSPSWTSQSAQTEALPDRARDIEAAPRFRVERLLEQDDRPEQLDRRRFDDEQPSFDGFQARWWGLKF